jgi:hypothetical protein
MKGGKSQTVTQQVDPVTQRMQQDVFNAGKRIYDTPYSGFTGQEVAGPSGISMRAQQELANMGGQYGNLANMGQNITNQNLGFGQLGANGMAALGGDQGQINKMMNPYLSGVINQVKGQYGDLNAAAQTGIQDQATKAGAFGGSRHGVASGVASGEIAKGLGQQIAGLSHQGYNDAMGRAGQLANLGLGGLGQATGSLGMQGQMHDAQRQIAGQQFGMGDHYRQIQQQQLDRNRQNFNEQRDWDLRGYDAMRGGLPQYAGSTQSQPMQRNVGAGILGGAATGAQIGSIIPGIGTGIGALAGGLFGMF